MAASKSIPTLVAAAPIPRIGAVTFMVRFLPTSVIFCPASCIFLPTCSAVSPVSLNCFSNFESSCSALTTSRWKARYCSSFISPLRNCSLTCSWAARRRSSFSRLFSTASARSFWRWANKSVLPGSSFRRRSTCLSSDWTSRVFLFTSSRALLSFWVSPPISIVIPLILPAISSPPIKISLRCHPHAGLFLVVA